MTVYNGEELKIGSYQADDAEDKVRALLVGRKVVLGREDTLVLDNGVELQIEGNYGCGGCPSGYYTLDFLNEVDNAIMSVEFKTEEDSDGDPKTLSIYVYTEMKETKTLVEVSGDVGNGYYGWGYYINVHIPND